MANIFLDDIGQIVQYRDMTTADFDWQKLEAAAERAGVPYFTRRKWRERKRVPVHWWPTLEKESDGELTSEVFMRLVPDPPATEREVAQ